MEPLVKPQANRQTAIARPGAEDETLLDVDAILDAAKLGLVGGPSKGGISWHTIANYMTCRRKAYFAHVLGFQSQRRSLALSIGTLFHAAMELHFRTGGANTMAPIEAVRAAGGLEIAAQVTRMVHSYLGKYGEEQAGAWDIRGLEVNAVWHMGPYKIAGKKMYIPATCRHDMIAALLGPGDTRAPMGPHPNGVWILDFKTTGRITYDLYQGYGMDGQFLTNCLIYENVEQEQYGPLNGVMIDLILKGKKVDATNGAESIRVPKIAEQMEEFHKLELEPAMVSFVGQLVEDRDKIERWPKNRTACKTCYGMCPYFNLCDIGPSQQPFYDQKPDRVVYLENFAEPPAARKSQDKPAPTDAAQTKRDQRAWAKQQCLELLISDHLHMVIDSEQLMKNNDSKAPKVKTALAEMVRKYFHHKEGKSIELILPDPNKPEEPEAYVKGLANKTGTGFKWHAIGLSGTLSWKAIAAEICKDWWSVTKNNVSNAPRDE